MGKTITLCGPAGAGHALKALNNYLSAAGLVAMCEALVVGETFGLDPGTMVDVFNSSTGKSNATEVKGRQFVVSRSFAAGFTTALMAKDLRTAGDVAIASQAPRAQPRAGGGLLDRRRRQARQGRRPHRDLPLCRDAGRGGLTGLSGFDSLRSRNLYKRHLGPLAPPPGGDRRGPPRTTQHSFHGSAARSIERVRHSQPD